MKTIPALLAAAALALAGCSTRLAGSYQTPQQALTATVDFSTNTVDLSGSYAATNQVLSGAITLKP